MVGKIFSRLVLFTILLAGVVVFDAYRYASQNLRQVTEGDSIVELSLVDSFKYLAKNYSAVAENRFIPVQSGYYPIVLDEEDYRVVNYSGSSFYVYDDEETGEEYIDLDASGNPTDEEGSSRAVAQEMTHLEVLQATSYTWKFKIPIILGVLFILGMLKDIFGGMGSREVAPAKSKKAREKQGKKLVAQIESYVNKGKHSKLIEVLNNPTTRELIPRDMDRFDLPLGKSYMELGESDKAISALKRYANKFKDDDEVKIVLGELLAEHRQKARIQDMPYLLAHLEQTEDEDYMKFVSDLAMKHKATDRNTVKGLTKICGTPAGTPELREYVLQALMQFEEMDEVAIDFYEACKAAEPENPKPVLMLAEAKLASGKFNEALDELESLLNMDYENQRVHDMLFTIYQLKEELNDLFQIYATILEDYEDEPIAIAAQRKIQGDPSFNQELADANANLSLAELLAKRKEGDSSADNSILKKYEKRLTIMFTDIKGYTAMTESQSVVETMAILQESDDILPPIIAKHEGVVIKKIGDAFMARFDTADSAIMAAVQIQQKIYQNNKRRESEDKITWHIRVGLNTGDVIVKDGDVFGDAVNVASRVESSAEADQVYCTKDTCEGVSNPKIKFEKKDMKKVKGKSEAIELFGVIFDLEGNGI